MTHSAKSRRQPKAVAPKKMACIEEKLIINVACNSGSSAMVTREGEVYIFGKDCTHCDSASGVNWFCFYCKFTVSVILLLLLSFGCPFFMVCCYNSLFFYVIF